MTKPRAALVVLLSLLSALLTAALVPLVTPSAGAAVSFAPASSATVTPGVQMVTGGAQCTANFVFTDGRGRTYLGYAAHCAGLGSETDTNGCTTRSLPLGTPVTFETGGSQLTEGTVVGRGRLAYSSWLTMQRLGTRAAAPCAYNDLALVRVAKADRGKVNPSVPSFGGPAAAAAAPAAGASVSSYGNSSLRAGLALLSPKRGVVTSVDPSGWSFGVITLTPGVPGDSGSGFLDAQGHAVGVLSTLSLAPIPGENGVGSLLKELRFAQRHAGIAGLRLAQGTVPFGG